MRQHWEKYPRRPISVDSWNTSVRTGSDTSQSIAKVDKPISGDHDEDTKTKHCGTGVEDIISIRVRDQECQERRDTPEKDIVPCSQKTEVLAASSDSIAVSSEVRPVMNTEADNANSRSLILSRAGSPTQEKTAPNSKLVDTQVPPNPAIDLESLDWVIPKPWSERTLRQDLASSSQSRSPLPPPPPPPPPPGNRQVLAMEDPNMGIALLSGILCGQWVDVQRSL